MTTFDETTTELRSQLWRPFGLGSLVWVLVLAGFALFGVPRANRGIIWAMVGVLALVTVVFVAWMARRTLRLGERQLTTHLVPGSKPVDRDDIADVRVVRQAMFSNLQIIHQDRRRTMLNLTDREANAERNATAIRLWAGIEGDAMRLRPAEPSGEQAWTLPRANVSVGLTIYFVVQALAMCAAPLWTTVPWQGWAGAALSVGLAAYGWWRSRPTRVTLQGDELVVQGPRSWRLQARDVGRVVTLSSSDGQERHVVESVSGSVGTVARGDEGEARAAMVQKWASGRGGGIGRDDAFESPRSWELALFKACMFLALAFTAHGLSGGRHANYPLLLGFGVFAVVEAVKRDRVVRDWSRP
ncbi:hypothetical protein [Luteococcus sp. OSA5]|uniref:hypothetical protein n=1 Tax=Luteococcus sp. OSA5 TaxID=3401630 RepID=UPI003B43C10E